MADQYTTNDGEEVSGGVAVSLLLIRLQVGVSRRDLRELADITDFEAAFQRAKQLGLLHHAERLETWVHMANDPEMLSPDVVETYEIVAEPEEPIVDEETRDIREDAEAWAKNIADDYGEVMGAQARTIISNLSDDQLVGMDEPELYERAARNVQAAQTGGYAEDEQGQPAQVDTETGLLLPADPRLTGEFLAPTPGRFLEDYQAGELVIKPQILETAAVPGIIREPHPERSPDAPRYDGGFPAWGIFTNTTPERISQLQDDLIDAGLLDADQEDKTWFYGKYIIGDGTYNAVWALGGLANTLPPEQYGGTHGVPLTWMQALEGLKSNPLPQPEDEGATPRVRAPFIPDAYRPPDYATLSGEVRNVFVGQLGRQPTSAEMLSLARQMTADHAAEYDRQVEAARLTWERTQDALDRRDAAEEAAEGTDEVVGDFALGGVSAAPMIDPVSRMTERFMRLYQPEMELAERQQARDINVRTLRAGLGRIRSEFER